MAQAPIFSPGSFPPCQDHQKNQEDIALEIVVNIQQAHSLKNSKGQLRSPNMFLAFA
jgi:hypothetical protein